MCSHYASQGVAIILARGVRRIFFTWSSNFFARAKRTKNHNFAPPLPEYAPEDKKDYQTIESPQIFQCWLCYIINANSLTTSIAFPQVCP